MIDKAAMFSLTYGLYMVGVEADGKENACAINTVVQATSSPYLIEVTIRKSNLTTQMIRKKGSMTISVLSRECPLSLIAAFGQRSGRDFDKFAGVPHKVDASGNPYFEEHTVAYMSLNVNSVIDLGSHDLFIGEVVEAQKTGAGSPMTYADYRILKSGGKVPTAGETQREKHWVCTICHYVYDGEIPFEELPDDWKCPVCNQPKSVFVLEG